MGDNVPNMTMGKRRTFGLVIAVVLVWVVHYIYIDTGPDGGVDIEWSFTAAGIAITLPFVFTFVWARASWMLANTRRWMSFASLGLGSLISSIMIGPALVMILGRNSTTDTSCNDCGTGLALAYVFSAAFLAALHLVILPSYIYYFHRRTKN